MSPSPSVAEVRAHLHPSEGSSTWKGLSILAASLSFYVASFLAALVAPDLWLKLPAGVAAGFAIASLFVVGHDAAHNSLTASRKLNELVGRIALLPAYHPFTSWVYSHNVLHHGYTNVRGLDPVFAPLGEDEYARLSSGARRLERWLRSPAGIGASYIAKVWLPFELFPSRERRPGGRRERLFQIDRALVLGFLAIQVLVAWHAPATSGHAAAWNVVLAVAFPALVWFWLMGWAVHLHHTHPSVPWFADRSDWTYFRGQVQGVVHSELPWPLEQILHHIMDHTAHHADPRIPLYGIHAAQERIEAAYPTDVVSEPFTLGGWLRIFRRCRLFDYREHRWLDWDGTPTSRPLLSEVGA